ncbi:MAG: endonuclease/exonuclease/phosphatase family protein [Smithella sp.]
MKQFAFARKAIDHTRSSIAELFDLRLSRVSPVIKKKEPLFHPVSNAGLNLNVMSFNIRRGNKRDGKNHWTYRRELVHEILNQYRPDVLGLQEALDFQISEVSIMLPGYEKVGIGNRGGSKGLHNAIFFNAKRFQIAEEGTFWLSDTPDCPGSRGWGNIIPRICTWARLVEIKTQHSFYFYNTHLDHLSQRSREKSVIFLTHHIHARPVKVPFVLTGDFNARERNTTIQYLKGKISLRSKLRAEILNPVPLMDAFRVRHPWKRNSATFNGFGRYVFRFKFDYIFVPSSAVVSEAMVINKRWKNCYPSDHFPVLTRIALPVLTKSHPSF